MPLNSVLFALGYGAAAFFTGISINESFGFSGTFTFGIVLATISLVACWSVFGTGGFFKRILVAHGLGAIVALGTVLGLLFLFDGPIGRDGELLETLLLYLGLAPPLLIAAQLPYWILRVGFGWQFTTQEQPLVTGFSLRDIFLATFVCAIALGSPQITINHFVEQTVKRQLQYSNTRQTDPMIDDSKTNEKELMLTQRQIISRSFWASVMGGSLALFVINWVAVPVLLLTFRPQKSEAGCMYSIFYAVGVFCTLLVFFIIGSSIWGGLPLIGEPLIYLASTILTAVGALAAPLMMSRNGGLTLTSPKRYQKQMEK